MPASVLASPRTVSDGAGAQSAIAVERLAPPALSGILGIWLGPSLSTAELAAGAGGFSGPGIASVFPLVMLPADLAKSAGSGDLPELQQLRYLCPDRLYTQAGGWNNHTYAQCDDPVALTVGNIDPLPFVTVHAGPPTNPLPPGGSPTPLPCGAVLISVSQAAVSISPSASVFANVMHCKGTPGCS